MGRRFSETFFNDKPDELLTSLFNRKSNLKKELENKKLRVVDFHYKLQENQYKINKISKLIFQTLNLFIDSFSDEFKNTVKTLQTTTGDDFSLKVGVDLKQILLFNGPSSNSYLTANSAVKQRSSETLTRLIKNLKEDKDDLRNCEYSSFIDSNFTQIFKYNLANLSHIARAFLKKEDFMKIDGLFFRLSNIEVLNKQYIAKCDSISNDMYSLASLFVSNEFTTKRKTPSTVNHVLVVKGRNIPPGTILRINKDNYKHYWRGLAKVKKIDILFDDDKKGDVAKDNVLFLQEF